MNESCLAALLVLHLYSTHCK